MDDCADMLDLCAVVMMYQPMTPHSRVHHRSTHLDYLRKKSGMTGAGRRRREEGEKVDVE
jgi:hypothetical protein